MKQCKHYWRDMMPEEIRDSWQRFGIRYTLVLLVMVVVVIAANIIQR